MSHRSYSGYYYPERFVSNSRPEQLAAQIIQIYSLKDVSWHALPYNDMEYLIPRGRKQEVLSVDLGAVLPGTLDIINAERIKSCKKKKIEEDPNGSIKFRLPDSLRYLEQYIISEFIVQKDSVCYSFTLRPDAITLQKPLEFCIINYLAVNKEFNALNSEKIFMWTEKWGNSTVPTTNFGLWYVPAAFICTLDKEVIKRVD